MGYFGGMYEKLNRQILGEVGVGGNWINLASGWERGLDHDIPLFKETSDISSLFCFFCKYILVAAFACDSSPSPPPPKKKNNLANSHHDCLIC